MVVTGICRQLSICEDVAKTLFLKVSELANCINTIKSQTLKEPKKEQTYTLNSTPDREDPHWVFRSIYDNHWMRYKFRRVAEVQFA